MLVGQQVNETALASSECHSTDVFLVLLYLLGWGGRTPVLNWCLFVFGMSVTHISKAAQSWYLGYWAGQYQELPVVNVE